MAGRRSEVEQGEVKLWMWYRTHAAWMRAESDEVGDLGRLIGYVKSTKPD